MMKWKVVKNPRSASVDRSLECLRSDVQPQSGVKNDSNNNVGEDSNKDNDSGPPVKETNKQRDSSLNRKPSVVATDCLNLKSFLGLSRQRSETNLSNLGLVNTEPRRSRSEVRGLSCDRLAVGYHTNSAKPSENGKTRSSSPPSKSSCWIRGRKRERESRNPVKNNLDAFGKTIVTGSNGKRTSSKTRNGETRTIVDGSDGKQNKVVSTKSSLELRKSKGCKRSGEDDIIEEEVIYSEIEHDNVQGKLLEENKEPFKDPKKVIRKKGLAPKPQIAIALFKESSGVEVNLNPNGRKQCGSPNSLNEFSQIPPNRKPQRRNQTYNGRNQDRKTTENRVIQSVKLNNLKNSDKALIKTNNNINVQSVVAVAEIHKETDIRTHLNNKNKNVTVENIETSNVNELLPNNKESKQELMHSDVEKEEPPPYHIDTPDYSTLDSVNCCSFTLTEDLSNSRDDIVNCDTDCDESIQESSPLVTSENAKSIREISLSSILRDSNENKALDSVEPKKTVRFEKLDLIEKYKKHKTESLMDTEDDTDVSICEVSKPLLNSILDVNSNEILSTDTQSILEDFSPCSEKTNHNEPLTESDSMCPPGGMTVNVFVRNPSPIPNDTQNLAPATQIVVKKSFVITVAKQERGFRSLCDNKKPDVKNDQQISVVTFLCSGPPSESWVQPNRGEHFKQQRSISVPPLSFQQQPQEVVPPLPVLRGRSRERRSKERSHCKKNHKSKKKETPVFVMPQAVIDELSQVLEKRNPCPR